MYSVSQRTVAWPAARAFILLPVLGSARRGSEWWAGMWTKRGEWAEMQGSTVRAESRRVVKSILDEVKRG